MTVCTPHSYGGPQACPYCRIVELEKSLRAAEDCINLAIAELEGEDAPGYSHAVERAIALLKGAR